MIKQLSIAIIGAGSSGLAMAAHLLSHGHKVKLWNRSKDSIEKIKKTGLIKVEGVINSKFRIDLVTTNIRIALDGVELVMITTPANSHREIAEKMAKYIKPNMLIVLNPGRTCGAIEFVKALKNAGCIVHAEIAETQTIIYTCRKIAQDCVLILAFKRQVLLCGLDSSRSKSIIQRLPSCLQRYFIAAKSMVETSLGNVGMILHCAPMLFNIGWIENSKTEFKYYYEGITPTVARFLEQLDKERLEVAVRLGQSVDSTSSWLRRTYGVKGRNLYDCIQNNSAYQTIDAPSSLAHRYITEDVPCGLVPLEALGRLFGLPMKTTGLIIDLICRIYGVDFRENGRNLKRLELTELSAQEIRRHFKYGQIRKKNL